MLVEKSFNKIFIYTVKKNDEQNDWFAVASNKDDWCDLAENWIPAATTELLQLQLISWC